MSNPLPTIADVKEVLTGTLPSDAMIARVLNGTIEWVERSTVRVFSTGIQTRRFDGNDKGYLMLDDYQRGSVTRVAFLDANYNPYQTIAPANIADRFENARDPFAYRIDIVNAPTENPYRMLGKNPYVFPQGIQNVEVTATWGTWAILPDGLQLFILELVKQKLASPAGNIRSLSVGGESVSYGESDLTPQQRRTLAQYTRGLVEVW